MRHLKIIYFLVTVTMFAFACQEKVSAQVYGNTTGTGFSSFGPGGVGESRVTRFMDYATGVNHATASRLPDDPLNPNTSYFIQQNKANNVSTLSRNTIINNRLNLYQKKGKVSNNSLNNGNISRTSNPLKGNKFDTYVPSYGWSNAVSGLDKYKLLNAKSGVTFTQKLNNRPLFKSMQFNGRKNRLSSDLDRVLLRSKLFFGKPSSVSKFKQASPFSKNK